MFNKHRRLIAALLCLLLLASTAGLTFAYKMMEPDYASAAENGMLEVLGETIYLEGHHYLVPLADGSAVIPSAEDEPEAPADEAAPAPVEEEAAPPSADPEPVAEPEPAADPEPAPETQPASEPEPAAEPEQAAEPEHEEEPVEDEPSAIALESSVAPISLPEEELLDAPEETRDSLWLRCGSGTFNGWSDFWIELGEERTLPDISWYQPELANYRFDGWYYEKDGQVSVNAKGGDVIPEGVEELHAKWVRVLVLDAGPGNFQEKNVEQNYTRTVDIVDGKLPQTLPTDPVFNYDKAADEQDAEFIGWFTEKSVVTEEDADGYHTWTIQTAGRQIQAGEPVDESINTLYAGYRLKTEPVQVVSFKMNYNGAQGSYSALIKSATKDSTFDVGDAVITGLNVSGTWADFDSKVTKAGNDEAALKKYWAENPVNGYTFIGWFDEAIGGNEIHIGAEIGKDIKDNQTIYAHWSKDGQSSDELVDLDNYKDPAGGPLEDMRIDGDLSQSAHPGQSLTVNMVTFPIRAPLSDVTWYITLTNSRGQQETLNAAKSTALEAFGLTASEVNGGRGLKVTFNDKYNEGKNCAVTVTAEATGAEGGSAKCGNSATLNFAHSWYVKSESGVTDCTHGKETVYGCKGCDATKTEKEKPLEHLYNFSTLTTTGQEIDPPTCTEPGLKKFACLRCGEIDESRNIVLPATGHSWSTKTESISCNQSRVTTACTVCGESKVETVSASNPSLHKWSAWSLVKEASPSAAGSETRSCSVCGQKETRTIPMVVSRNVLATPKLSKAENVSNGVKVSWNRVSGAAKYRVFYKTGNTGWTKLTDTTATNYTWASAKDGTDYAFTVSCLSADGKATTSNYNTTGLKITTDVAAPKISSVSKSGTSVKISWGKVTGAAKYRVFYKTGKGKWTALGDTTATSYTWKKAKVGTAYSYTVRCISANGKTYTSDYNTTGTKFTLMLDAPAAPKVAKSGTSIKISWGKVSGAAKYRVLYRVGNGKWTKLTDTKSTSYTWKKAKAGTDYSFTVCCISSDGKTVTSAYNTTGTHFKLMLGTPKLPKATKSSKKIKLSWSKVSGAEKYRVYYKIGNGNWIKLTDTKSTSYTWSKPKSGTTYYFTVCCISSNGKTLTSAYNTTGTKFVFK